MRSSPLREIHERLGATFGEFAGWEVPSVYSSAIEEHMAVRRSVGIFDISHMGRLLITGAHSVEAMERVYTKRISKTKEGFMSGPTLALNSHARVIDDEMLYNIDGNRWLVVPNAAAHERMLNHLASAGATVTDVRDDYALLAIQGPKAVEIMEAMGASWAQDLKPLEFRVDESLGGERTFVISRSGWTGEDGFEIVAPPKAASRIFMRAVELGARPAGITARDTLRMEMGFVLLGSEYGEDPRRFPCAVSLRYGMGAIDWGKRGYIGEEALRACRREGSRWLRIGIVMRRESAKIIPRAGSILWVEDVQVGWVTSGSYSPVLERGIAQAYIDARYAIIGESVEVEVRGERHEAKLSDFPFVRKP